MLEETENEQIPLCPINRNLAKATQIGADA